MKVRTRYRGDPLSSTLPQRDRLPLPKPEHHFSDLPSALDLKMHDGILSVEGAGFVTLAMIEDALLPFPGGRGLPARALIDLRNVSGYEASCVEVARRWLEQATDQGVQRIAFVANSSVVRTATEVVAQHQGAPLRTFGSPRDARAWLSLSPEPRPSLGADVPTASRGDRRVRV